MSPSFDSPPLASTTSPPSRNSFSQPRPRPAKSAAEVAEVRVKNRRRAYLDRYPAYFESSEHEFANPLLYDSLIRRFKQPEEMREEAEAQGFARVLEGSLMRGEERLSKLAAGDIETDAPSPSDLGRTGAGTSAPQANSGAGPRSSSSALFGEIPDSKPGPDASTSRPGEIVENQESVPTGGKDCQRGQFIKSKPTPIEAEILGAPPVRTREEGLEMWHTFLRERFIRGGDEDFDYAAIDEDDDYDVIERRDQEEAWYDDEEPEWACDDGDTPHNGDGEDGPRKIERVLEGETGIQDY